MARALELAKAQEARTSPNPWVGAVIVHDGEVVGEGATEPPGGRHAEVVALDAAGERARGAEIYVTLEPCSFQGRTAPCAEALVRAGVRQMHYAMTDPDPRVSGRGATMLREAGIEVEEGGDLAEAAQALLEPYSHQRRTGRPLVTAKFAVSLDGKIAATSGDSRWVSSEESRSAAHEMRARVDAILVGSETVVVDNPSLTARPGGRLSDHQPLRVVLDGRGRVSPTAEVFKGPGRALVITSQASAERWRSDTKKVADLEMAAAGENGGLSPQAVLRSLNDRGVLHLLLEGGGQVHGSFFDAGLVDRVYAVIAPMIIGGPGAGAVVGRGAARMADAWRLERLQVSRLGPDILVQGIPRRAGRPEVE
ncbi:MAG: bifunctional diaminohydroxyphosphoribosylaminopyrimidine deaminase/5-amino-6-(5-phosphoribosylamino)uracil reductase RibD [Dehalococcoidia bacterium]